MTVVRTLLASAALAGAASLAGCSQYGLKGDRGLPPPSETIAYPNINLAPAPGDVRRIRASDEQEQLKSRLLASRPRTARSPRPFDGDAERRKIDEAARRAKAAP